MNLQGEISIFRRILGGTFDRHFVKANLIGALAAHVFVADARAIQMATRKIIQAVVAMRLQNIGLQQSVVRNTLQANAVVLQYVGVVLQILSDLSGSRVLEPRL